MYRARQLHTGVDYNKGHARRFLRSIAAVAALALAGTAMAAPIAVPNGDFSDPFNNGQVGGGVLGGSGSSLIGNGPWSGTYQGIATLLAPPLLTVGSGHGSISGLAGVNVGGIVDNSGYFSQTLSASYGSNRHYVLSATVDAGVPLNVGVLNSGNAGIALMRGATELASTTGAPPSLVTLSLLNGTTYKLVLTYDTGAVVVGNVGVKLFAKPQNLLTANLLTSVSFGNVTLSSSALNPVAASIAPASGTPQGAQINTGFSAPLTVTVLDADGDPVAGASVTFAAPTSGASATLSATTVLTDASGNAQVTGVANGIAGSYVVTATVGGVATGAQFDLTNLPGGANSVGQATGTPQSAMVNTPFASALGVTVIDAGSHPVSGITVTFNAPNSGASVSFPSGNTATTDSNGNASIDVAANTIAGDYTVTASVTGGATQASFSLTNTAGAAAVATPIGGTPQTATVSTPFNVALSLQVTDAYGNPVAGADVTFTAPGSGASATFPPNGAVTTVQTDAQGVATVDATANAIAGGYIVNATSGSLQTGFNLTNSNQAQPITATTSGANQAANVQAAFKCLLQLRVTDQSHVPISGASIDFAAPASGPSATLSNGTDNATLVTAVTDSNGLAGVTAQANATPGTYDIAASMHGTGSALASYTLTNLGAGDDLFGSGFDTTPAVCP